MIRFEPDDWIDVVLRPFDMVSPEANIYVEVAAPDIRLAAVVVLLAVLGALAALRWGRTRQAPRATRTLWALLGLTALAMAPWLFTTGNGRYFIPFLVLSGPLCVGLVRLLPTTAAFRVALASLLVVVQVVAVAEASPWRGWAWLPWRDAPYFQIAQPPAATEVNYVTVSTVSYSLIAPQFPPQAGWVSGVSGGETARDRPALRRFLASGRPLVLVAPALPHAMGDDLQPLATAADAIDDLLAINGLSLRRSERCGFLPSQGMALLQQRLKGAHTELGAPERTGFWLCPLDLQASAGAAPATPAVAPQLDAVFEAVERLCPRFFRPGEARTQRIAGGHMREYAGADTKVYVLEDGEVMYKFWRSLNAVTIARVPEVLAGQALVDCRAIRAPNWRRGGP